MSGLGHSVRLPRKALAVLWAVGAYGCTDDLKPPSPVDAGAGVTNQGDAATDATMRPMDAQLGAPPDATLDTSLAHDDGARDDGALATDLGDAGQTGDAAVFRDGGLSVLTAQARQVGRFGSDLRLDFDASANAQDIVVVRVELLGPQEAPRGSVRELPLVAPITTAGGTSSVLLTGAFDHYTDLTSVRIVLVDDASARSAPFELAIARQPIVELGASCDSSLEADRCALGLGCKGPAPSSCMAGEPPTITRAGYFVDRLGPRILIEGSDPDVDADGYTLKFLDGTGAPVAVKLDQDLATPGSTEFTGTIEQRDDNRFFVALVPSSPLIDEVASLQVTVFDQADHTSAPALTLMRSEAPERGLDASCDPRGFHLCPEGSVCSGSGDQARCRSIGDARQSACEAALVLTPGSGTSRVRGTLGSSLWDPPAGCSFDQTGNADRVVKLVLTQPIDRLVLSTDSAYTGFDSELYLLDSCNGAPRLAWCVADQAGGGPKAILTLTNLPAGEYYVVVESFPSVDRVSTTFELSATIL